MPLRDDDFARLLTMLQDMKEQVEALRAVVRADAERVVPDNEPPARTFRLR